MIVVINPAGKAGHSFKGLHAYLSHDVGKAQSSERVAWTATRNLATHDPGRASKIMTATALSQSALKREAGIAATGRQSRRHVGHIVLSFHKDEPSDPDHMMAAADALMAELGVDPATSRARKNAPKRRQYASEHQAIYYCHTDTDNHHLHIMLNTVHPEHGCMLPTGNDQLKAQDWALEYTKTHGTEHATPARQFNKDQRRKGEYVKALKRRSRQIYDVEQALPANDTLKAQAVLSAERQKTGQLLEQGRKDDQRRNAELTGLGKAHLKRLSDIDAFAKRRMRHTMTRLRTELQRTLTGLERDQKHERKAFEALETHLSGKIKNTLSLMDFGSVFRGETPSSLLSRSFRVLGGSGARLEELKALHAARRNTLEKAYESQVLEARQKVFAEARLQKKQARRSFAERHAELTARHERERESHKSALMQRKADYLAALEKLALSSKTLSAFKKAEAGKVPQKGESTPDLTHLLDQAVRHVRTAPRDAATEQDNDQQKGRGR